MVSRFDVDKELENVDKMDQPKENGVENKSPTKIQPVATKGLEPITVLSPVQTSKFAWTSFVCSCVRGKNDNFSLTKSLV